MLINGVYILEEDGTCLLSYSDKSEMESNYLTSFFAAISHFSGMNLNSKINSIILEDNIDGKLKKIYLKPIKVENGNKNGHIINFMIITNYRNKKIKIDEIIGKLKFSLLSDLKFCLKNKTEGIPVSFLEKMKSKLESIITQN